MRVYSNEWFELHRDNFEALTQRYAGKPVKCLEIGSFEGRSSNWIVENWCTHPDSRLTCVDPFTGSDEHSATEKNGLFDRFISNVQDNLSKITVRRQTSVSALAQLIEEGEKFDFVYVDGDHHNFAALVDGILGDKVLKVGGVLGFDDYRWGSKLQPYDRPGEAVDYFLRTAGERYEVLLSNYQVFAEKKA